MKEINIWGKAGCELPDGRLCSACCILPNIELEGNFVSVGKPAHSPCPYLGEKSGCSLHLSGKPEACVSWHCSMADVSSKFDLIAQGLSSGLVSTDEATDAGAKFLGGGLGKVRRGVLARAAYLRRVTYKKDLVSGDLDET